MIPGPTKHQLLAGAQLVRWPNLLIVGITQLLLYTLCLLPAYQNAGIPARLDAPHFTLLLFCTLLLAAGSYLINDLYDEETDRINKPERALVGVAFSAAAVWRVYLRLGLYGLLIAIYLSWKVGHGGLFFLYPAALGLLWAYARYFKCQVLTGNIVVALFCALVAGILLVAEAPQIARLAETHADAANRIYAVFTVYMVFAFLSTLYRELVKDIEDVEGDRKTNCNTLPIAWGTNAARSLSLFFGALLLVLLFGLVVWLWNQGEWAASLLLVIGSAMPALYSLWLILKAKQASDFSRISKLAKIVMLGGLLLILFL